MPESELPPVLTYDETADILRVSRRTVYSLVKRGHLKRLELGAARITRKSLLSYLDGETEASAA